MRGDPCIDCNRISAGIQKRVGEVLAAQTAQDGPVAPGATLETSPVADAPQGLPEAPASVNVRLTIRGRECQITLRDTSEERLLERLQTVLERFPVPEAPTVPAGDQQGWCATHGVSMKLNQKDGRQWFSHKQEDGTWCKGTARAARAGHRGRR